jgi:hypothetical protein
VKCIHCQTDTKRKDRPDGKCPKCNHAFAFEPALGAKFTDPAFEMLIERVSSLGTVRYTERNLYYEAVRRLARHNKATPWVLGLIAFFFVGMTFATEKLFLLIPGGLFVLLCVVNLPHKVARISYSEFANLLALWRGAHGTPKGLIVTRDTPAAARPLPSDIQHYSFDRAVITDRRETADLLLANNFHFENNCAVLTIDGYPESAFDVVRAMLKNNPKLSVFVLHDATLRGQSLARELVRNQWFQPTARIVDVGLGVRHMKAFKGAWQVAEFGVAAMSAPELVREAPALARYTLEVAAIRPEQTIKRLFRAMSGQPEEDDSGSAGVHSDGGSFSSDASSSDGGGDSFG